jgi:hypothetical protein
VIETQLVSIRLRRFLSEKYWLEKYLNEGWVIASTVLLPDFRNPIHDELIYTLTRSKPKQTYSGDPVYDGVYRPEHD